MTLRSIAEAIGMHESTISRVTANKAIGSDSGTYPMKYFFSTALNGADGADAHSSEAVRHRIKALIAAEGRGAVLSDDAIAQRLRLSGVAIARRTVAKYREALRIPPSAQRRRSPSTATLP
jgi:RNA polymerase sigma-54 factor